MLILSHVFIYMYIYIYIYILWKSISLKYFKHRNFVDSTNRGSLVVWLMVRTYCRFVMFSVLLIPFSLQSFRHKISRFENRFAKMSGILIQLIFFYISYNLGVVRRRLLQCHLFFYLIFSQYWLFVFWVIVSRIGFRKMSHSLKVCGPCGEDRPKNILVFFYPFFSSTFFPLSFLLFSFCPLNVCVNVIWFCYFFISFHLYYSGVCCSFFERVFLSVVVCSLHFFLLVFVRFCHIRHDSHIFLAFLLPPAYVKFSKG